MPSQGNMDGYRVGTCLGAVHICGPVAVCLRTLYWAEAGVDAPRVRALKGSPEALDCFFSLIFWLPDLADKLPPSLRSNPQEGDTSF